MNSKCDLTDLLRWNQDEEAILKNNLDFLKYLNIDWFKNVFKMYLGRTPLLGHPIEGRVIRARLNETDNFNRPSQLSYNSENKDRIKTGRFNREKQPMFYGTIQNGKSLSHAVFTSCLESFPEIVIGDGIDNFLDFTVGTWKVVSEFYLIDLTYDKIKSKSIELGVDQALDKIKSTAEGKILDILFDFWDFVSNICSAKSKSELDYLLTNILLDVINDIPYALVISDVQHASKVNGLVYPSSRTERDGTNVVLYPQTVDDNMILESVIIMRIFRRPNKMAYDFFPISDRVEVIGNVFNISQWSQDKIDREYKNFLNKIK